MHHTIKLVICIWEGEKTTSKCAKQQNPTNTHTPAICASCADILFPVSTSSIAFDLPMARVSRCVPPAPRSITK